MKRVEILLPLMLFGLTACGIEEAIRKNDDRYAQPGAMDMPVTAIYKTYQYKLIDRYRVTHQWPNTSACAYAAIEDPPLPSGRRSLNYVVSDLYEQGGKTWQAGYQKWPARDFDPWVRSVKWVSREKGKEGQVLEVGLQPVCFEYWWSSSHYLVINLRASSIRDYESSFAKSYGRAQWSTRQLNGLSWRVAEIPLSQLEPRPFNGLGGPYQAWLIALGDTGYVMSIEMGASKESLDHPQAHAAIEGVLRHLVNSLKVERLAP
jgi:hypothetical protein